MKVRWKAVVSGFSYIESQSQHHVYHVVSVSYISELHDTQLSQGRNDLAANLVGHIELGQRHVRRAEKRVLFARHDAGASLDTAGEANGRGRVMEGWCRGWWW